MPRSLLVCILALAAAAVARPALSPGACGAADGALAARADSDADGHCLQDRMVLLQLELGLLQGEPANRRPTPRTFVERVQEPAPLSLSGTASTNRWKETQQTLMAVVFFVFYGMLLNAVAVFIMFAVGGLFSEKEWR
mmetsp:Transcript_93002/g.216148  ORF Transcript_93002/g.216148 Transcript_93002/m.216148 type:complete len:138 (-) Transcript_93002:110-523(-)